MYSPSLVGPSIQDLLLAHAFRTLAQVGVCSNLATIMQVSTDLVDKLKEFPLLSDEGGKIASAYESVIKIPFIGAVANRQTFIIDPKGAIMHTFESVKVQGTEVPSQPT